MNTVKTVFLLTLLTGILILAENPSHTLQKISEVYDRIAFAGVGKYNEFETLRKAGIRHADVMGYMYSRADVTAMGLATAFSETLGQIFSHEAKPYEVEILICELGIEGGENHLFRVTYDGTLSDEREVAAIGGKADALVDALRSGFRAGMTLSEALVLGTGVFAQVEGRASEGWEGAVLDSSNGRRTFRRLTSDEMARARGSEGAPAGP